jgi:type III secretion system export apparatus protein
MFLAPLDMEFTELAREYGYRVAIGAVRITACFAWLPYLSSGAISSKLTRTVLSAAVLVGMWPLTDGLSRPVDMLDTLRLLGTEALIGASLGLLMAFPYHAFHALGALVDNQRGASISSALDPLSGIEATETANLLQLFSAVLFLSLGGLTALLDALRESYLWMPPGGAFEFEWVSIHRHMGALLSAGLRMAAPVILLLLLLEVFLGVLSRYAQQMNAFSVSLAIKSFVAFLALSIYFTPMLVRELPAMWQASSMESLVRPAALP